MSLVMRFKIRAFEELLREGFNKKNINSYGIFNNCSDPIPIMEKNIHIKNIALKCLESPNLARTLETFLF